MAITPQTKIYNMIHKLKIVNHKKRQEFLSEMILGLIKGRSVIFSEISAHMEKDIKLESKECITNQM